MPKLSLRLRTVASLVPSGARVCDIGTDHAYLAIELMRCGIAKSVIAADIGEKPLENARKSLERANLQGIELRLCDGLSGILPNEVDTIVIAGMGGEVISGILKRGAAVSNDTSKTLLLQPTTSPEALRIFLCENGFEIIKELPVFENGKLYSVMLVKYTGNSSKCDDVFRYSGKLLPDSEAGLMYLSKQRKRCFDCMTALESIPEKEAEYTHYKAAFAGLDKLIKEHTNGI